MLILQWPVWESESNNTKFNTPAPHSHLRPCNTNESHDTGERKWLIGPNLDIFTWGVLTFVASGLDINGCVLIYFEGTSNVHCYTCCTLTNLHWSKVSFLQCCHMKRYNKIFTKMWGAYSLLWDTACCIMWVLVVSISKQLDKFWQIIIFFHNSLNFNWRLSKFLSITAYFRLFVSTVL